MTDGKKLEMALDELRDAAAQRRAAIIAPSQALQLVNLIRRLELSANRESPAQEGLRAFIAQLRMESKPPVNLYGDRNAVERRCVNRIADKLELVVTALYGQPVSALREPPEGKP